MSNFSRRAGGSFWVLQGQIDAKALCKHSGKKKLRGFAILEGQTEDSSGTAEILLNC